MEGRTDESKVFYYCHSDDRDMSFTSEVGICQLG